MTASSQKQRSNISRRRFLQMSAAAAAAAGATGLSLFHFQRKSSAVLTPNVPPRPHITSWDDLYRKKWTWDSMFKGSHGWLNCRSACEWDIYVKDGIVVREEQSATYEASEPGVPDFNPRGCQKGACYSDVMYGPSRLTVPLRRVGERGAGQWKQITWDEALDELATKLVDVAVEHGTEAVVHDLGPHFDYGATTIARTRFFGGFGATLPDDWGEIGDLNMGATLTFGFPHVGGSSDEWFLSDYLIVWMMNPSVTQMADAHFLYEAKYNGAKLVVISPEYSATAVHADSWIPIKPGTDAALALAVAKHIWDTDKVDLDYVREQTDLPLLVRLDTGRFLRASDLQTDGKRDQLYIWDTESNTPAQVHACAGSDEPKLDADKLTAPIEGVFETTLPDGTSIRVAPVGTLLREQLETWTFEHTATVTGLSVALIEQFAQDFADAERPMVLSSWGSNRYLHSDLMNRAKILCLSLKGAVGKRGAGYHSTGWVSMEGFEFGNVVESAGLYGLIHSLVKSDGFLEELLEVIVRKKTVMDMGRDFSHNKMLREVCATNSASFNYTHQGIQDDLATEQDDGTPRPFAAYVEESERKGWMPTYPKPGNPPKVWVTGGNNVLRRTNLPQNMLKTLWPKLELIVDINPKMTFTGMHADMLLPAAGYYEKPGIKYPVAYIPYLHYCDAAVAPVGESKNEWEILSLLAQKVQAIAKERNTPILHPCGKDREVELQRFADVFSYGGAFGPLDAEGVTQNVLDLSTSTMGMEIDDLKKTGVQKFTFTGVTLPQAQLYNYNWTGEGVMRALTQFVEHKWRWPTLTGRQQFYIDHPWFLETGEALPTHKESPKAGGDHRFQLISCHARWSVHSVWRDTPILLRLQRGEPVIYLNPTEAEELGIADGAWAALSNRYGDMRMRCKYSTMVRPGVAYYFHAWEPHQFADHKSYKWLTPGLMNPLHFAGGEGHLGWRFAIFEPGTHVQDTRVDVKPWNGDEKGPQ